MTPEEQAELEAAKTAKANAENEAALARAVAKRRWLHNSDAEEALKKRLARSEKGEIVFHSETPNDDGTPREISGEDAANELAASRPNFLAPPEKFQLPAAKGNVNKQPAKQYTFAELMDPKNQSALEEMITKQPKAYSRLRAAFYEGGA